MKKENLIAELFDIHPKTFYSWKRENKKKILHLIDMYISDDEISEFLKTNKIKRLDYFEMIRPNSDKVYGIFKNMIETKNINEASILYTVQIFRDYHISLGTFMGMIDLWEDKISSEELYNLLDFLEDNDFFSKEIRKEIVFTIFDELESMLRIAILESVNLKDNKFAFIFFKIYIFNQIMKSFECDSVTKELEHAYLIFDKNKNRLQELMNNKEIQFKPIEEMIKVVLKDVHLDIEKIEIEEKFESKDSF